MLDLVIVAFIYSSIVIRTIITIPILFPLTVIAGMTDSDALISAGYLISMWAVAGRAARCSDIRLAAYSRSSIKLGDWLDTNGRPKHPKEWTPQTGGI